MTVALSVLVFLEFLPGQKILFGQAKIPEDVEYVGNTSSKSHTKEIFSHMFLNYHVSQVSCEVDMLLSRKKSERKIFC